MPAEVPLRDRLKEARLRTAAERRETVSQARMGELVGAIVGRPIYQSTWSEYESGKTEPPLDVFKAVARLSKLSFLYLTLGRDQEDNGDDELIDPARDRKLTPDEEERAMRVAAAEREAEAARRRGKGARRAGGRKR